MRKAILSAILAIHAAATFAFVLPEIGNGTNPGELTSNIAGVRAAAKQTGYPIFVAVINDSNSGEGCTHCKAFLERNLAGIKKLAESYKFYIVILNYWQGANGYSNLAQAYRVDFGTYAILPSICVRKPDGSVSAGWGYPLTERDITSRIEAEIEKYAVVKSTFSVAADSTVSAKIGSPWTGKIVRSGNSKKTGSVAITLSGAKASEYTVTPANLSWDAADGAKTFTIQGPAAGEALRTDALSVKITATGFSGSKITYGTQQMEVTFKDSRIKETLDEFADGQTWLAAASSAGGLWYVPASGAGQLVCGTLAADASSTLTLTVKKAGTLTVEGLGSANATLSVNGQSVSGTKTVDLPVNGQVTITAKAQAALAAGVAGLKSLSYETRNEKPVFPAGTLSSITAYAKVESALTIKAESSTKVKYSAKGLPDDMVMLKESGEIIGAPMKAGTYKVTVTAKNEYGSTEREIKLTVGKLPATIKGSYSGILFDAEQQMVAGATWKVSSSGKCSVIINRAGVKTKVSAPITVDAAGNPKVSADGLELARQNGSGLWVGSWKGLKLYGKIITKGDGSGYVGTWNAGLAMAPAGYATAKVTAKGAVTIGGKLSAKTKISAKGQLLVLDGAFVAENLPEWYDGGDVAFVQGWKKASGKIFDGGAAFYRDGTIICEFSFNGVRYENVFGRKWSSTQSFRPLDGTSFVAGAVEKFRVSAPSDKKLAAAVNDCKAKLSAAAKSGIFKGSFAIGKTTCKFEGVLFVQEGVLVGVGGGMNGKEPLAVTIGLDND